MLTTKLSQTLPIRAVKYPLKQIKYNLFNCPRTIEINGSSTKMIVDDLPELGQIEELEMYESEQIRRVLKELNSDDVFYDVGANIGAYTCLAAEVTVDGEVIAFEPLPTNIHRIRNNIQSNGLSSVSVQELALSDTDGDVGINATGEESPGHSTARISNNGKLCVSTATVDSLIADGLPEPDVMKIDVEGAERRILAGMKEVLSGNSLRVIFCEVHPNRLKNFSHNERELFDFLKKANYDIEIIKEDDDGPYHIKASKQVDDCSHNE